MDTGDTPDAEREITEIAADGDTTLIVGPEKKKLGVHSFILQGASDYFAFEFAFITEARSGPFVVPLPNHEAGSVEIICNILHHRNHAVPKFLTPSKVLMVAITALSLDCIVALTWASVAWLKPADPNDLQGLSQLMAAAYVMENSQDFSKITLAMILHHNSPYCEVSRAELHLDKDVYWHIMYLLEQKRADLRTQLDTIMVQGLKDAPLGSPKAGCRIPEHHNGFYVESLVKGSLWSLPGPRMTISNVLQKLQQINYLPETDFCPECDDIMELNWKKNQGVKLKEFFKDCDGICMDCIRRDAGDLERVCQIAHK